MWHLPFSQPLDIQHPLSTPINRVGAWCPLSRTRALPGPVQGVHHGDSFSPSILRRRRGVEPRTAPPMCSALGRKVAGEGRGRSAGGSEETEDWLERMRSRNQGASGGPGARTTGNRVVAGARNPGSPSARKPGSCSRAVERQGTGAERGAGRHGNGAGRPSTRS